MNQTVYSSDFTLNLLYIYAVAAIIAFLHRVYIRKYTKMNIPFNLKIYRTKDNVNDIRKYVCMCI